MKGISKTKIEKRIRKKRNPPLRELIIKLKKDNQLKLADLLASPRRKSITVNIEKINKTTKADDVAVVPGKILGKGNIEHKITIAAFSFSQQAKEKLKDCKIVSIDAAIKNKNFKVIC
jgi:large subunit ribosomal protein L18e